MSFKEKYLSCYVLATDQISLYVILYFVRYYIGSMCIEKKYKYLENEKLFR